MNWSLELLEATVKEGEEDREWPCENSIKFPTRPDIWNLLEFSPKADPQSMFCFVLKIRQQLSGDLLK